MAPKVAPKPHGGVAAPPKTDKAPLDPKAEFEKLNKEQHKHDRRDPNDEDIVIGRRIIETMAVTVTGLATLVLFGSAFALDRGDRQRSQPESRAHSMVKPPMLFR